MLLATSVFGTLPGWLTIAAVIGAAWSFRRGGGGSAIESLQIANRVLEKDNRGLAVKVDELTKEVAVLRGRTDVAVQVQPIQEQLTKHELRAQERHDGAQLRADERSKSLLLVLDLIARRLGPDTNDHGERAAA